MQHTNGSAIRNDHVQSFPETTVSGKQSTPERWTSEPPAKEFCIARVVTRVWANPNHWGDITWRVDQIRVRHANQPRSSMAKNFHPEDLQDAMRGLYQAQQWIRKAERRRFWRSLTWRRW